MRKLTMAVVVAGVATQVPAGGAVLSRVADAEVGTCGDGVAVFDDRPFQMTSAAAARLAGKTFFRRTIEGGFAAEVVKGGELFVVTPIEKAGEQPEKFKAPKLFAPRKGGNSFYTSYCILDGKGVLWYNDMKFYLGGRIIGSEWFE